jgi:aminopeptidase N
MRNETPPTIYRKDYHPPVFHVTEVEMGIDLDAETTVVATRLHLVRNQAGVLVLDGEALELVAVHLDGRRLPPSEYVLTDTSLSFPSLPERCTLDLEVRNRPQSNTTLMGLFESGGSLFTQCEAEGFRRITYFPDRPDVMARYTVMLRAKKSDYPVLLSNGNLVESGNLPGGRHYAKWHDPFPKPSYLFALVAGHLSCVQRRVKTASGRSVLLQIHVKPADVKKVDFALDALVHSLRWDEKRFGLELDLDRFMIVAVEDFTMGAMENKGLNIFNAKYVLANAEVATDADYRAVEAVVGHEYFHNWTGNRVTCRDWFQLTLKEGLTVFRDQEFSADMSAAYLAGGALDGRAETARAVGRINQVRGLRMGQYPEDAGPMAHPIRPESYQEISNFYTPTVYEKGAEVVRMLQTLLGREGFRAGVDEYFRRFDGQAVTCDDFVSAMESVYTNQRKGEDLAQFRLWYSQAGTPRVEIHTRYDAATQRFYLRARQACPRVGIERNSDVEKRPFHIPFALGLLDKNGQDLALRLEGEAAAAAPNASQKTRVLELRQNEENFVFVDVREKPVPSLLRNFSAPVIVQYPFTSEELAHLSGHDSDAFNRWEASQRLAALELARLARESAPDQAGSTSDRLVEVFRAILLDDALAPALKELALILPSELVVGEELPVYDPQAVHRARKQTRIHLAAALRHEWEKAYHANRTKGPYSPDPVPAGKRALKNLALSYLASLNEPDFYALAFDQFQAADNMTDRFDAFTALINNPSPQRESVLAEFHAHYCDESMVMDKWLRAQVVAPRVSASGLEVVKALMSHGSFSLRNPNKVYAVLLAFFSSNPAEFHSIDGLGHAFWAEQVLAVDALNPQVASRLARSLDRWRKLTPGLQVTAEKALRAVQSAPHLSKDVAEIVGKSLSV